MLFRGYCAVGFGLLFSAIGALMPVVAVGDSRLPRAGEEEFWDRFVEGETIRYMFSGLSEGDGEPSKLQPLLDRLQGVRLYRQGDRLMVTILYDAAFRVQVRPEKETPSLSLYQIQVPRVARFAVKMRDGILTLKQLETDGDGVRVKANIPWVADTIWIHGARVDLVSGEIQAEAGVLGDLIRILAKLQVRASEISFSGISLWERIADALVFQGQIMSGAADSIDSSF